MVGVVLSHKMSKTAVVRVERRTVDRRLHRVQVKQNKFKIHDERDEAKIGDTVLVVECRPLSCEKRFRLKKVLRKGEEGLAPEVGVA